ncbi:hypothetical protein CYMTET_47607 [Cymbomonas tetramitiformis]|uniref:Uncharacterized protein n=1 Tax=Cymbomonas tetramitiformis TaxID=36881 RepID=A0AAE0BV09_9CHLO|nr:hypothetical protein CYMTET_47607 [Cymbomonas tetramitiformis]
MNVESAKERCIIAATAVSEAEQALTLERLARVRCEATLLEVTKAFSDLRQQGSKLDTAGELYNRLVSQGKLISQLQSAQSNLQKQLAGHHQAASASDTDINITEETALLLLKLQDAFKLVWELTHALEKALAANADSERHCQRQAAALAEKEKALDELEQLSGRESQTHLREYFQKEREEAKRFDSPIMFQVTREARWFGP